MPYIVNIQRGLVTYYPSAQPRLGEFVVDSDTASACGVFDGQTLTENQVQALRDGSPSEFRRVSEALGEPTPTTTAVGSVPSVSQASATGDLAGPGARAVATAGFAEVFAWISGIAGVILGIAIAMYKEYDDWNGYSRPYVGLGVGVALASVFQASLLVMVAAFVQWRIKAQPIRSA